MTSYAPGTVPLCPECAGDEDESSPPEFGGPIPDRDCPIHAPPDPADECRCGWGGAHDPDNPRCPANAPVPSPAPADWRDEPHVHAGTDCGGGDDCPARPAPADERVCSLCGQGDDEYAPGNPPTGCIDHDQCHDGCHRDAGPGPRVTALAEHLRIAFDSVADRHDTWLFAARAALAWMRDTSPAPADEREGNRSPCPAALNIAGAHYNCSDMRDHGGAHWSRDAEAIWTSDRNYTDDAARDAALRARVAGRLRSELDAHAPGDDDPYWLRYGYQTASDVAVAAAEGA